MPRDITPLTGLRENLILQEEKILQAWRALVPPEQTLLAESLADSVRDLLLLMYECLSGIGTEAGTDTRHLAYQIAQQVLEEHDYQTLINVFRDALQEAVMDYTALTSGDAARNLIAFFTIVTDAYWLAYSDGLRKAIRHQYRERLSNELRVAKRIQQRLLPKVIPQIPGWEIAGRLVPALEVGGDYWSVKHYANDGVITCKLADVTGHGIGAAILVAAVKFISGGFYRGAPSASWVMERTNHVLVVETPSDIMVTMVYTWIRPATGQITLVNAGHGPVFACRDGQVRTLAPTGPALGLLESRYSEVELQIRPGDILFFCSDGIIEARSRDPAKAREMFGTERLHEVVCGFSHLPAAEIADKVVQTAIDFSGTPNDDMSLVVIKRVSDDA
ncbi:MAG TPA: PP2C family protein-serine/threonine phosphatase [Armatimonadota bacterium]|nr:PP2C family protein-serine/threonine phosphatase [Armatimonadota bacterium]